MNVGKVTPLLHELETYKAIQCKSSKVIFKEKELPQAGLGPAHVLPIGTRSRHMLYQ